MSDVTVGLQAGNTAIAGTSPAGRPSGDYRDNRRGNICTDPLAAACEGRTNVATMSEAGGHRAGANLVSGEFALRSPTVGEFALSGFGAAHMVHVLADETA